MNFIISASTDIGIVKKTNQDSFRVMSIQTQEEKIVMAIMCDGMGGLAKGEVASSNLVLGFEEWTKQVLPDICKEGISDERICEEWTNLICQYNEKIKGYGREHAISLGTTITAMLITENRYYIVNVGDSRAYEILDKAISLTKDQTLVQRRIDLGEITKQEAKTDPQRSVLLQCVGASDSVYPDIIFGTPKVNAMYMLCSDGFRHEISREELGDYFSPNLMLSYENMKKAELDLINLNKQRREQDNISVITIRTY